MNTTNMGICESEKLHSINISLGKEIIFTKGTLTRENKRKIKNAIRFFNKLRLPYAKKIKKKYIFGQVSIKKKTCGEVYSNKPKSENMDDM